MASPVSRELSITYNGYKVGGDQSNRILRDLYKLEEDNERAVIEYRFTVKHSTKAAFAAECLAAETAFRAVHKDTSVDLDGTNLKAYSHSGNTGFNSSAKIIKAGEPTDSARSRTYTIRVEVGLPGTGTGARRLLKTSINIAYSPARRKTLTINAEYTASGATSARANFEASIDAFATAVQTAIGGTWKLAEQPTTNMDDDNKVVQTTRIYEEIIYTGVGASDADVRREVLVIGRDKVGPGDTPTANRLVTLNVHYEAWINKEASTDLHAKWATLLVRIMTQVRTTLGSSAVALISENPHFDYTENRITATLVCMGSTSGGVVENRVTTSVELVSGEVRTPIWHLGPYDRYIFDGPATDRKTITIVQKTLSGGTTLGTSMPGAGGPSNGAPGVGVGGTGSIGGAAIFGGDATGASLTALVEAAIGDGTDLSDTSGGGGSGGYRFTRSKRDSTPIQIGRGGYTLDLEEITATAEFERVSPVS